MDERELHRVRGRALAELSRIPGVLWVGFGVKEVARGLTDRLALRVYVAQKRPRQDVAEAELIPDEFDGLRTDVVQIARSTAEGAEDRSRHSPLLSGITITHRKIDPANPGRGMPVGSIGFFATMAGLAARENIFLVCNNHTLEENGGANGDTLYQPGFVPTGLDPDNTGPIGKIHDAGARAHHQFQDQGDAQPLPYYVDCGMAKIDISISSWCDTNCGQSYRNRLHDFGATPNDRIESVARAVRNAVVAKSGRSTGRTSGTIVDVNGAVMIANPALLATNIIIVRPTNPPDVFFSDTGDSGAPLLDAQNRLVGLHFGSNREQVEADIANNVPNPAQPEAHSCHIGAVLDFLSGRAGAVLTPISAQNPPIGPAGKTLGTGFARQDDGEDQTVRLRERALATPIGARLLGGFMAHRDEVVALVNQCRPVLLAWHRGRGPAFVAHLSESARAPGHVVPQAIDGQDRGALLAEMAALLSRHGSSGLAAWVAANRDEVLALLGGIDDLHATVARLEAEPVDG